MSERLLLVLVLAALGGCDGSQAQPDAGSLWTRVELPHGQAYEVEVTSVAGEVHFIYVVNRRDPDRFETCHWPMSGEASRFDVFDTRWGMRIPARAESYSAISGAPAVLTYTAPDRVNAFTRAWSPTLPNELKPLYVCQELGQARPVLGMHANGTTWVQRSTTYQCYDDVRTVSCPRDGAALFLAGDSQIRCPFSDPALAHLASAGPTQIRYPAMHPQLPVGGFNSLPFFEFDADGGLAAAAVLDAGPPGFVPAYFHHQFWPTTDLPVRRLGVIGPAEFELLSWVDGGIEAAPFPQLSGRLGRLRGLVETTRGVIAWGEAPRSDGGLVSNHRRFVLLSRDGQQVLQEHDVRLDSTARLVETDAGIFVFKLRRYLDAGVGHTVEYTQLPGW